MDTNHAPVLAMNGISKRFPGVVALSGVSFEVYSDEVVALIGENGAGKSTLMKILGGVIKPDAGTIHFRSMEISVDSPRAASELGIEFIHQELSVLDNLDIASNIFLRREPVMSGWLKLIDRKRLYREADAQLSKLGLEVSSRTSLSKLSLAQQQLVEISRAIFAGARLLIMDEPTSSLTLSETRRLLEIVEELRAQGVSIIYISHRLDEVKEIADRVVVLRDGRNAGTLLGDEIDRDPMVRMMVGRDLKEFFTERGEGDRNDNPKDWLTIRRLRTLKYPDQAVSLSVGRGEVLGIAGLVGSGRSDVARAVFGVDEPLEADIHLGGSPLKIKSPRDAIRQGLYLIPEDRRTSGIIVDFSIRENITLPELDRYVSAGLISRARETAAAEKICNRINVKAASTEMRAATLSGGNQQKVVLAKWLAMSPKVLILTSRRAELMLARRRKSTHSSGAWLPRASPSLLSAATWKRYSASATGFV